MTLNTLIIDDLPHAIANLRAEIEDNHPEINIVDTADGVMDAAKKIKKYNPDLIFLDIHMGDGDGFDLLEMIRTEDIKVIFTTASKEHAIKAFQYSATDYLLKPVDPDLLKLAIEKIYKPNIEDKADIISTDDIITLNTQEEIRLVKRDDIVRLESMGNYTRFYIVDNSKVLVTKTMKEFVELVGSNFIRVHQSHMVNKKHIRSYIKTEGGYLLMNDESRVPVSVRKKAAVIVSISKS
jgi:two-component system LytT family response regulator